MATYRKPLKDIDGNFIIPAMTGDQTEWVQTGDIADGAVTADKIDFTTPGFQYQPGTYSLSEFKAAGRIRHTSTLNNVQISIPTPMSFATGATISFTPDDSYGLELFGSSGAIFSSTHTQSAISSITCAAIRASTGFWQGISMFISFNPSVLDLTNYNNIVALVKITGTITVS